MEIIYRAFGGTKLEKTFTSEEECRKYEELNGIKMWDWTGERTDDLGEAMILFLPPEGDKIMRERWGKLVDDREGPLAGLIDEDGMVTTLSGFYFWDTDNQQFFYAGSYFIRSMVAFFKKNADEINDFFCESIIVKYN